jgi:hypothetical protein
MKPSARRVLERLRQGPATTHDLMQADVGGCRFGARIRELRELGFAITESRLPLPTRGSRYELTFDVETSGFPSGRIPPSDEAVPPGYALAAETDLDISPSASGNRAATHATEIGGVRHAAEGLHDADSERALSEAHGAVLEEQADLAPVPSQEGVRSAAPAQPLFDADAFADRGDWRDVA